MALDMQRRPSSWFGPQFTVASFPYTFGSISSQRGSYSRGSINDSRRTSNLKPATPLGKLPMPEPLSMPEPLFMDSYLSTPYEDENISPSTPDPKFGYIWEQNTQKPQDYFSAKDALEDFNLSVMDDDSIVATYVSIVNLGKPKVVDIRPQSLSRQQSPRESAKPPARPAIIWRMPSYESNPRSSDVSSPPSERTESFDSHSTDASSVSDVPNTPPLFDTNFLKTPEGSISDPSTFIEPVTRGSLGRSSTQLLRRHSRNLSASFSKAFLNRLKEADTDTAPPPPPLPLSRPDTPDLPQNYSLPYGAMRRPRTAQSFVLSDELHMPSKPQYLTPLTRQAPVLRRKKSIAGVWF